MDPDESDSPDTDSGADDPAAQPRPNEETPAAHADPTYDQPGDAPLAAEDDDD